MSNATEHVFDPVLYSVKENEFLYKYLGEAPVVAMKESTGCNPRAVQPVLQRVFELEQLKKHDGAGWCGVEALKDKIAAYLRENAKWKADAARSKRAPRFPTMYSFDSRGRGHRGGIGSDSGRVRTYFDAQGNRIPLAISYVGDEHDTWQAPGFTESPQQGSKLKVDTEANRLECTICGHTESFKPESRSSHNAARARMSKHLRRATDQVDDHRELHTQEFS